MLPHLLLEVQVKFLSFSTKRIKEPFFQWSCMDVRVGLWRKLSTEKLMLLNCGVGEDPWESLGLQGDPTSPSWRRSVLGAHWKDWCWSWSSNTLAISCEELTYWKRLWCWEGLGAGGEGDDRGWDGWMASLTWWAWVWVNSGSWWWTGRPGVLQFMGLQRVGHDWATELNVIIICQLICKTQQWPQDWKRSVSIPTPKKGNAKGCSNYHVLVSHASKLMLKILQGMLQQYVCGWRNFQIIQVVFQNGRGIRDKLSTFIGSQRKQGSSRKTSISASLTTLKPLTVWITTNCGKFFKRWEYQITLPVSWETCMQVKKQQLELNKEQLVPNWERSMTSLYIVTLLI